MQNLAAGHEQKSRGKQPEFVQIRTEQRDRRPGIRRLPNGFVDKVSCPDVQSAGRIDHHQKLGLGVQGARHDDLLLIAAAQ